MKKSKVMKTALKKAKTAKKTSTSKNAAPPGLKKQYLKTGSLCRVTFRLPGMAAPEARNVSLVGDFNNWNPSEATLKKLKSGDFTLTLQLPKDREYRFRYLIDSSRWENDWCADRYDPNNYGCDDSVVII